MARREHLLTTTVTVDDADGTAVEYDLVRIILSRHSPMSKTWALDWECGKLEVNDEWIPAGGKHQGAKSYLGADYDTLHDATSGGAGETYMAEVEDQVYADLATDGVIGAGTQQDYSS